MNVFIAHPSHLLTNHRSHGDGLTAYGFIAELARRGHTIHVSVDGLDLTVDFPANVTLHKHERLFRSGVLARLEYMIRVRSLWSRLSRRTTFDVIHQMNPVYLGLSLAFAGLGEPIVLGTYIADWPTKRGGPIPLLKRFVRRTIAYVQQHQAAALLVTTRYAARSRVAAPVAFASKTFVVPHGIDVERFRPANSSEAALESRRVLFVGNLHAKKGIYDLLGAIELLRRRVPEMRLIVAGDGPERAAIATYVETNDLGTLVELIGNVSRDELPSIMRSVAMLCCPSHGEPLGMVAIEAMASGLPIVATRDGGLGEIVDERGGVLVDVGAPQQLANAIERLFSDDGAAAEFGAFNRARAVHEYAWPAVVDELERVYENVSGRRRTVNS